METSITTGILFGYLAILLAIGFYSSRKAKTSEGFFVADRRLNTLLCTATITATVIGGSATIVAGGQIFQHGLPGLWYDIAGAVGLVILGIFLAHKVRKTGLFTLPEITGKLFDNRVRKAAAVLIIITEIAWVSLLIQSTGFILSVLFTVDYQLLLVGITLIFILYTILGGQYAVAYTDFLQFIVMIVGVCIIATPLLFFESSSQISALPTDFLSFPANSGIGIFAVLSIFMMMLMPHIVGPDIYSKLLSCKNEKTAKRSAIYSGLMKLIFAVCIGVIALAARVLYPSLGSPYLAVPTAVAGISPILGGIILASFVSIMLSSADSCLLSAGSIISVDILGKKNIFISRIGILCVGVGALVLALYLGNILDTLKLAYTVFTAGLTLPILFGFYREKTHVTSFGALLSLISGGVVSIIWLNFTSTDISGYAVLPGLAASLIPLLIIRGGK